MNCPNCNQPIAEGVRFCINCGADVAAAPEAKKAPAFDMESVKNKVKSIPSKYLAYGGIGVVAIIAIILVFALIIPALSGPAAYGLYIKENELNMTKLPGTKSWQVTEELLDGDFSDSTVASLGGYLRILVSEDGKRIFYYDKLEEESGFNLYYKSTSDKKGEGTKIASDVEGYMITPNGKKVIYVSDGAVYTHNLKEKTKIASDVKDFKCSTDLKKFYWTDEDGDLYFKNGNKDKEKIASEITEIEHVNEKFTTIHYVKDDALYVSKNGKDGEKIDSDIASVIVVYDDGTAYYTKADEDAKSTYWDYVEDSNAKADKALLEGDAPDYYDDNYEEYWAASRREDVRNELKEMSIESSVKTLFYYNGKDAKELSAEYVDWADYSVEKALIVYSTQAVDELKTVKLSDYDFSEYVSAWDIRDDILGISEDSDEEESDDEEDRTMYVAVKDKSTQFDQESAFSFNINEKGDTILFLDDRDEKKPEATLYKMTVSGSKVKKPEKVDDEVYTGGYGARFLGKKIVYLKDFDDEKFEAELYVDKKSIASEVYVGEYGYNYNFDIDNGKIFFYTDWDSEDYYGTLNVYNGKKVAKIYEEVSRYTVTEDGDVLFLYDVSDKHYTGELWFYNGKAKKIDEDVSCFVNYTRVTKKNIRDLMYYMD